jgi:hypothetical protein
MPPRAHGYAWPEPFTRGESVLARLTPVPGASPPHTEDHQSWDLKKTGRVLPEDHLVAALKQAEVALKLEELFGCEIQPPHARGNSWIPAGQGYRSICGFIPKNIYFRVYAEPARVSLRAQVASASGERLSSLPVVDREWIAFLTRLMECLAEQQSGLRAQDFLNRRVRHWVMKSPNLFARVGLARGMQDSKCWLMLDSLFPQPKQSWLEEAKRG